MLEGSVRKAGQRLRINVQLIDARNGYQLWSERFDREVADIFAIQGVHIIVNGGRHLGRQLRGMGRLSGYSLFSGLYLRLGLRLSILRNWLLLVIPTVGIRMVRTTDTILTATDTGRPVSFSSRVLD